MKKNFTVAEPVSSTGEAAITILNGDFAWDPNPIAPTVLHQINLSVPSGSLVMVTGEVGCGKSSLLAALLGEMCRRNGHISLKGSVAYAAQV